MNDITNGLGEEIERVIDIRAEYIQSVENFRKDNEWTRAHEMLCRSRALKEPISNAIAALKANDPERMAAALEILRGIKE